MAETLANTRGMEDSLSDKGNAYLAKQWEKNIASIKPIDMRGRIRIEATQIIKGGAILRITVNDLQGNECFIHSPVYLAEGGFVEVEDLSATMQGLQDEGI